MTDLQTSRSVFEHLNTLAGEPAVAMRAWDGDLWGATDAPATIVLKHPGSLRALLLPPGSDLTAGEAYIHDDIDIEGNIVAALEYAARLQSAKQSKLASMRLLRQLRRLPSENRRSAGNRPRKKGRLHSKRRDRDSVTTHYDTGNDFFRQFLDPGMVYSSAAFLNDDEPMEQAQRRKIDLICRKLELQAGQRLLDIGCGWGALAVHAARHYEVDVLGITLSSEQAEYATELAAETGLGDRTEFRVMDYRDVKGAFDAISSIGMFEHVGKNQLSRYFDTVHGLLLSGGSFLNHGIVTRDRKFHRVRPTFVNTYVFPDGELEPVDEVIGCAEEAGFELRDAESLRTSYARTLRHWVANLEANHDAAEVAANETTYRIWRLYMAGSAVAFDAAAISVYQLLFQLPERPWTFGRGHLVAADDR